MVTITRPLPAATRREHGCLSPSQCFRSPAMNLFGQNARPGLTDIASMSTPEVSAQSQSTERLTLINHRSSTKEPNLAQMPLRSQPKVATTHRHTHNPVPSPDYPTATPRPPTTRRATASIPSQHDVKSANTEIALKVLSANAPDAYGRCRSQELLHQATARTTERLLLVEINLASFLAGPQFLACRSCKAP